jgi:hypothetical protein
MGCTGRTYVHCFRKRCYGRLCTAGEAHPTRRFRGSGEAEGLSGSIGQPAIGRVQGAQIGGIFGFWAKGGSTTTSVDIIPMRPAGLHVETYPNPFREQTAFRVDLPWDGELRVDIIDAAGRTVSSLQRMHLQRGYHSIPWSARDKRGAALPSGAYRAIITAVDTRGMVTHSASVLLLHAR